MFEYSKKPQLHETTMKTIQQLRRAIFATCVCFFLSLPGLSLAAKDSNLIFDEAIQVDGKTLVPNGNGIHLIRRVKIFAIAVYLPKAVSTQQELFASSGPVRLKLVMLKEVESELMSRRFLADIRTSTSKEERNQLLTQLLALGEGFAAIGDWKVGDVMTIDWSRNKGTVFRSNGKQIGETLKDDLTMHAILRIWLGDNVVDPKLKRLLLGEKE